MSMNTNQTKRWKEIAEIWKNNRWLFIIAGWILGLITVPMLQRLNTDFMSLAHDLVPEAIGIVFTVFIIDRLTLNRDKEAYKRDLIREMGSTANSVAIRATEALREHGWLTDGTLEGENFREANLKDTNLKYAKLNKAKLVGVNLYRAIANRIQASRVQMSDSDMRYGRFNAGEFINSTMYGLDARNTNFFGCDFTDTRLIESDFQNSDFSHAILRGTWLLNANLEGVNLEHAEFDENTVMPDGRNWTPQTDLGRFTDPYNYDFDGNPDFWRPDDSLPFYDDDSAPFWWKRDQE